MAQSYSNYVTLQNIWYHLQDLVLKIVCVCVCVCATFGFQPSTCFQQYY